MSNMVQERQAAQTQPEQAPQGGEEAVTPEEQDAFERVELAAKAIIYGDDQSHQGVMSIIQGGQENPAQALAQAAMSVFMAVDEQAQGNIPEVVMFRGVEVCLDLVIEAAEKTGTMQVDENVAAQALQHLVSMFGDTYGVDPAEIQGLIDSTDQGEVQGMVAQQDQLAGGGNGFAG